MKFINCHLGSISCKCLLPTRLLSSSSIIVAFTSWLCTGLLATLLPCPANPDLSSVPDLSLALITQIFLTYLDRNAPLIPKISFLNRRPSWLNAKCYPPPLILNAKSAQAIQAQVTWLWLESSFFLARLSHLNETHLGLAPITHQTTPSFFWPFNPKYLNV